MENYEFVDALIEQYLKNEKEIDRLQESINDKISKLRYYGIKLDFIDI